MASSEAEICSVALVQLNAKPITSLTENTKEAKLCQRLYPKTLQEVLRMAPWKCALKEFILSPDDPKVTIFTYSFSFQLPPDCIRVWATSLDRDWGGDGDRWEIMGRKLVSDITNVKILYVHRVTDVLLFDTLLEKALAYDLCSRLAFPITQLTNVQEAFDGLRDRACKQAAAIMSQEQTKKRFRSTALTEVR